MRRQTRNLEVRHLSDSPIERTPEFLEEVFAAHGKALRAFADRLTGGGPEAEDLVQETFLRAWRHPAALTGSSASARAWLFTVTRNLATDRWRRLGANSMQSLLTDPASADGSGPDSSRFADRVLEEAVVSLALDELSLEHRQVLLHAIWLDESVAQIASNLGIAPGTVKSRLHYALKALRFALERLGYLP